MTLDWVREAIATGVKAILSTKDAMARPGMINRLAGDIKTKLIQRWNEALNRVRTGAEAAVEREREEVE